MHWLPQVEKVKAVMEENISIAIENLESAEQLVGISDSECMLCFAVCDYRLPTQEEKTQQLEAGSQILQTASVTVRNRECVKSAKVRMYCCVVLATHILMPRASKRVPVQLSLVIALAALLLVIVVVATVVKLFSGNGEGD